MEIRKYLGVKLAYFAKKGNINKKLVKIISSDLFWILIIGAIVRLFYYSLLANKLSEDSNSYLNDHSNIFIGKINNFRTPVYPYFIKLIRLFGEQNLIRNIVFIQSVISYFSIICFYKITSTIFKVRGVIIAATLLYTVMLPVIHFDTIINTESLSISFIVFFIMLIVSYLKEQTITKALVITFATFFAIMLRPSFIVLIPITITFWSLRFIFYKKDKIKCMWGIAASFCVILLIHGYCRLNEKENGFYGISTVSNINQLDIIIISNMYLKGDDPQLSNEINAYFSQPLTPREHWNLLEKIIRENKPKRIADFIANCVKHQPALFVKRILRTTTDLQTKNIFVFYADKKEGILPRLVVNFQFFIFYTTFNKISIFLFFDFIFIFFRWYKTKNAPWLSILLWLIIVAQIAVAIIGAQSDYQRLILVAIPCLIIVFFTYIDRICYAIDMQKLKNYPSAI